MIVVLKHPDYSLKIGGELASLYPSRGLWESVSFWSPTSDVSWLYRFQLEVTTTNDKRQTNTPKVALVWVWMALCTLTRCCALLWHNLIRRTPWWRLHGRIIHQHTFVVWPWHLLHSNILCGRTNIMWEWDWWLPSPDLVPTSIGCWFHSFYIQGVVVLRLTYLCTH